MLDIFKSHYKRFSKFAVVGVLNTFIDFGIYSLLLYGFGVHFIFAHFAGFLVANINSFIFNSLWTFQNLKREKWKKQVIRFFLISLIGLGLSTIALKISAEVFVWLLPSAFLPLLFSKAVASGVSMVWNYIGSWLFVFKEEAAAEDDRAPS